MVLKRLPILILLGLGLGLQAAEPGRARLALLRAVPVKWDLEANCRAFEAGAGLAAKQGAEPGRQRQSPP